MKAQEVYLRENYFHMNWKRTPSGLQYLAPKTSENGQHPQADSVVTVHYEGKFITGKVFDSSYAKKMPLTISLAEVVPGWREGIPMMRAGEITKNKKLLDLVRKEATRHAAELKDTAAQAGRLAKMGRISDKQMAKLEAR